VQRDGGAPEHLSYLLLLRLPERRPAPLRGLDDCLSSGRAQFPLFAGRSEGAAACFLDAAPLFRWAAAILAGAAEDILRLTGVGAVPSGALGFNI
jgi:hypothetical protein